MCTPLRYGLLTGRYAWALDFKEVFCRRGKLIGRSTLTVQRLLKQHGYKTALASCTWSCHYEMPEGTNITQPKVEKRAAPIESRVLEGPITRDFDEVYGFHHAGEMRPWIEQDIVTDNLQSSEENAPMHLRKQQGRPSLLR